MADLGTILSPVIVLIAGLFVLFRFRYFSTRDLGGRWLFLFGTLLLFAATAWNWATLTADYQTWFITSAYSVIDTLQLLLGSLGALMMAAGLSLYADYWQIRRNDLELREGKLSVLENLQRDARQPYHLMELMNIAVKEILYHSQADACALFLVNRKRRQLVLTSSAGFSKAETASLEHYPLGRNVVSQAIELTEPVIAGEFQMVQRDGSSIGSQYMSTLVLPMVSQAEKSGAVVLVSTESKAFSNVDLAFLVPVAQWLGEKIKSARLSRELTLAQNQLDTENARITDLIDRLKTATRSLGSRDSLAAFCQALVGLLDCESAHLYGLRHGELVIHGGSISLFDLSENYKAALVDTLHKNKTLIVNQEATGEEGHSRVVLSSLICPLVGQREPVALLMRRESGPFLVDNEALRSIDLFVDLAAWLIGRTTADQMAVTRRLGFETILRLLRDEPRGDGLSGADLLVSEMSDILPHDSAALALRPRNDHLFEIGQHYGLPSNQAWGTAAYSQAGPFGESTSHHTFGFVYGRSRVNEWLDTFDAEDLSSLTALFGEKGRPVFVAVCPIDNPGGMASVVLFLIWEMHEAARDEWARLLTLASGMVSLRMAINQARLSQHSLPVEAGAVANTVNNSLAAILGSADLAQKNPSLSEQTRQQLQTILRETQRVSGLVGLLTLPAKATDTNLDRTIGKVLSKVRISGDLHMVGGRPREINLNLDSHSTPRLARPDMLDLFESALNRFTAAATEDDVISISTYEKEEQLFLDISRHRKNFPAVMPVAGFGKYHPAEEALRRRPSDLYLRHLGDGRGYCAVDDVSSTPAYLSFRFPLTPSKDVDSDQTAKDRFRILAIDDEAVILDLIVAMCRSVGYQVQTARSGEEGLALAQKTRFDLILTDLAMPGLSGLDVAREIRRLSPDTPVILVTGWEAEINSGPIKAAGIREILFKPFRIEQLTEVIRTVAAQH